MRRHGFQRKGNTWYRHSDWSTGVVNLQKSQWGPQYYINLGVWIVDLGGKRLPKENECHVQTRLCSLSGNDPTLKAALDLEHPVPPEQRRHVLLAAMEQKAIPFLIRCGTREGLQQTSHLGELQNALVFKEVRAMLGDTERANG